jgi:hypothetical protein
MKRMFAGFGSGDNLPPNDSGYPVSNTIFPHVIPPSRPQPTNNPVFSSLGEKANSWHALIDKFHQN